MKRHNGVKNSTVEQGKPGSLIEEVLVGQHLCQDRVSCEIVREKSLDFFFGLIYTFHLVESGAGCKIWKGKYVNWIHLRIQRDETTKHNPPSNSLEQNQTDPLAEIKQTYLCLLQCLQPENADDRT